MRLLVVDDDLSIGKLMRAIFEREGSHLSWFFINHSIFFLSCCIFVFSFFFKWHSHQGSIFYKIFFKSSR